MERRTSSRLSAVERTQAETNKKLDNINLTLQNIMHTVLSTKSSGKTGGEIAAGDYNTPSVGETKCTRIERASVDRAQRWGEGSSELWWDKLEKSGDDDEVETQVRHMTFNYLDMLIYY